MGITAESDVRLTWPQAADPGQGGSYNVHGDGGSGAVDYETALNAVPIDAWPDGAGLSGYGWGGGAWGRGGWGSGGAVLSHVAAAQTDGRQLYAVVPKDAAGNVAGGNAEVPILLRGTPEPPRNAQAGAYAGGVLTVTFDLSPDDDGA